MGWSHLIVRARAGDRDALGLLPVPAALAAAILAKHTPVVAPIAMQPFTGAWAMSSVAPATPGSPAAAGSGGRLATAFGLHPVAATVSAGALAAVAVVTAIGLANPSQRVAAAPASATGSTAVSTPAPLSGPPATAPAAAVPLDPFSASASPPLRLGRLSLEPVGAPGRFLTVAATNGVLGTDRASSTLFRAPPR